MSYLCADCGERWDGALSKHQCPNPGAAARLQLEIDRCQACAEHPQGDFCDEHYHKVNEHPGNQEAGATGEKEKA